MFDSDKDDDQVRMEDRVNDAEADLLKGKNVTFKDVFKNVDLTFDDVLTAVWDDDRFDRAFQEVLDKHPKLELYTLFTENARRLAEEYAEEEVEAMTALAHERQEQEAIYHADMDGELV